jgi:ribosomal protein S15P/S13E
MPKKVYSKKEQKTEKIKLSREEFEKRVLELAERGLTSEKIGEELRRQNIHPKEHGRKISLILKEKNKYTVPEIKNIGEKLEKIKKHHEKYKQDKKAMREVVRIFAQLRKAKEYHKIVD